MHISRIVIRNFRNFEYLDVPLKPGVNCIVGENNTGKTNLLHAMRLVVDADMSSRYRTLQPDDFHWGIDYTKAPQQVLVSVEITEFETVYEEAFASFGLIPETGVARFTYRVRPTQDVIDEIAAGTRNVKEIPLKLDEYRWKLLGGGDSDPRDLTCDEEAYGNWVNFQQLQSFKVELVPALRDVVQELRRTSTSPLSRLLESSDISEDEWNVLVGILQTANDQVEQEECIGEVGSGLKRSLDDAAGKAFTLDLKLGMGAATNTNIKQSLRVLLSDTDTPSFEPTKNGLGLNNVLYTSMLLEFFRKRAAKAAGQLLLLEEPEAHLHPQLQRSLYAWLARQGIQTLVTTHSTHVSSRSPLDSYVILTKQSSIAVHASSPSQNDQLTPKKRADLERYLDATRSSLLYAKRVILVEGPAEQFLIPPLVRRVMGDEYDLERLGISVIPIYGVHFDVYIRLFGKDAMRKKCAVVADGDMKSSDAEEPQDVEEPPDPAGDVDTPDAPNIPDTLDLPDPLAIEDLQGPYVRVFKNKTTFERDLTLHGTLMMFAKAAEELGAPRNARAMQTGYGDVYVASLNGNDEDAILEQLGIKVLATAKRFGKARFAQVASKYVHLASELPDYIKDAINWLCQDGVDG